MAPNKPPTADQSAGTSHPPGASPPVPVPPAQAPRLDTPTPAAAGAPPLDTGARSRPPASPTRVRGRHILVAISFLVGVVIPVAATAVYLWMYSADQYTSNVGFSVRQEDAGSALDVLGGLTNLGRNSSSDTDILFEFLQSQKLVSDMEKDLGLRQIWSKPETDPLFTIAADAPIEALVDYWNTMVRISYGSGSGLIEVQVRAFSAQDATQIAQSLLARSSDMINDLNAVARQDSIRHTRRELDTAVERLKNARAMVTQFRNANQLVDPTIDLQSQAGILGTLQSQRVAVQVELDVLAETVRSGDPRMAQAQRRLTAIEQRIIAERKKLGLAVGDDGATAFANIVGEYERLIVDREFAERTYIASQAAYDAALAEARRTSRYLATYMQPTQAETAIYPKRVTLLVVISIFLFLIWSIVVLVGYSLKDRR